MEKWKISEKQWREAIDAALNRKLYRLVSDLIEHLNSVSSRSHLSEELDYLVDKLISELRKFDLEFTNFYSDEEDLPRQITDAVCSTKELSDAADFYKQHYRIEPADDCFKDNDNGIFRIDDAAISEVIAEFTFDDDE
jgi:tRNA(Met) C34 N-acetyltransferase TmcA